MTTRRIFLDSLLSGATASLLTVGLAACTPSAEPAKAASVGEAAKLKVTGALLVASGDKKTKIKIKCEKCGYMTDEIEIDTPTAGMPYKQVWTCPKCGHKQTVTVEVAA